MKYKAYVYETITQGKTLEVEASSKEEADEKFEELARDGLEGKERDYVERLDYGFSFLEVYDA